MNPTSADAVIGRDVNPKRRIEKNCLNIVLFVIEVNKSGAKIGAKNRTCKEMLSQCVPLWRFETMWDSFLGIKIGLY